MTSSTNTLTELLRHPKETAAKGLLGKLSLFQLATKFIGANAINNLTEPEYKSGALLVSKTQMPQIYYLNQVVAMAFGHEAPPLYIKNTPEVNAFAVGLGKPFIVVTSGALDRCSPEQMKCVLAHEHTHIYCGHVPEITVANLIFKVATATTSLIPATAALAPILNITSLLGAKRILRAFEYTADRGMLYATYDWENSIGTLATLAGGSSRYANDLSSEAFLEQAMAYEENENFMEGIAKALQTVIMLTADHPMLIHRAKLLNEWYISGDFGRLINQKD
jgi:Zn-dependent protease with chaperone function